MTWWCRWFGHWDKRGPVVEVSSNVHFADYKQCRICGRYSERPLLIPRYVDTGEPATRK